MKDVIRGHDGNSSKRRIAGGTGWALTSMCQALFTKFVGLRCAEERDIGFCGPEAPFLALLRFVRLVAFSRIISIEIISL